MLKDDMANELLNTIKVIWDCMYGLKEDYEYYKGNGIFKTRKEAYALAKELSEADKNG